MRDIYLHGKLGQEFGEHYRLDVQTPAQALRLLNANFPGFQQSIRLGTFRIVRGDLENGFDHSHENLNMRLGAKDLHIVPVAAGGKGKGKAIAGILIVVAAFALAPATGGTSFGTLASAGLSGVAPAATGLGATAFTLFGTSITYGNIALFGLSMALTGVSQMLSPQPQAPAAGSLERPDERPSFVFTRPVNTAEQGNILPIVVGRHLTGSVVISGGLEVEQI